VRPICFSDCQCSPSSKDIQPALSVGRKHIRGRNRILAHGIHRRIVRQSGSDRLSNSSLLRACCKRRSQTHPIETGSPTRRPTLAQMRRGPYLCQPPYSSRGPQAQGANVRSTHRPHGGLPNQTIVRSPAHRQPLRQLNCNYTRVLLVYGTHSLIRELISRKYSYSLYRRAADPKRNYPPHDKHVSVISIN